MKDGAGILKIMLVQNFFSKEKALLTLHVMAEMHFLLPKNLKIIMHGRVKMYVKRWPFC